MSAVDVLAVMGDDRYAVPARIKDVIDSLKFDEKMRGHNPDRSTVDFPYAISILEAQAAKIAEARAAVAELMGALSRAEEMLRIAGPLVGEHASDSIVHYDGADCDGTCIQEDCRDAAEHAADCLARCTGEGA